MTVLLKNNVSSTLATAISPTDTGIVVASGSRFPTITSGDYFYVTLVSQAGQTEIVKVTARVGNSMTVVRAQDGSLAASFQVGALVDMRVNVASIADLRDEATEITIADAGGYYTSGTVEGALQEAGGVKNPKDVTALLADTALTYTAGQTGTVATGDIVRTRAEGFAYEVAASSAADNHIITAGGVKLYVQAGADGSVNVKAFGAVGDGTTNDTDAIQRALDSVPNGAGSYAPTKPTGGGGRVRVLFPSGNYLVTSVLDCSQRDYTQLEGEGRATIYSSSTSYILDMASTDHCVVKNLALYSATARVGIYIDRCVSAPFVQYNRYEDIAITLTTNTSANSGVGRIGIWNGRGELNHFTNVEIRADLPLYATNTADVAFPPSSGTLQTVFVTSVINTYIGCLFIGHTAHAPCMVLRGSISHEFIDGYWAQGNPASGTLPYAVVAYGISSCKFTGTVETLPSFMLIEGSVCYFNAIDLAFQNNLDGRGIIHMQDIANNVGLSVSTVRFGVTGTIPAGSAAIKVTSTALNARVSGNTVSCISTLTPILAGSNATVSGNILASEAGMSVLATRVISNEITSSSSTVLASVADATATTIFTTVQYRTYLVTAFLYNNGANFITSATVINDGTNVVLVNYTPGTFITLSASGFALRVTQSSGGPNDVVCRVIAL